MSLGQSTIKVDIVPVSCCEAEALAASGSFASAIEVNTLRERKKKMIQLLCPSLG